jgi:hypothetical protein
MPRWPESLPLRYAPEQFCDDDDVAYDDGNVWFHGTVTEGMLEIHDLVATDKSKQRARTGIGRAALQSLRPHFEEIVARQVGDDECHIARHPAFLFWRKMLVEGLIDGIAVGYAEDLITRENIHDEIATCYGTLVPSDGLDDCMARSHQQHVDTLS